MASADEDGQPGAISEKVLRYEHFLNERLKGDLRKTLEERDKIYEQMSEYLQLKNVIERIKESQLEGKELKTKVDLGCNFYVQAKVPDTSRIYVCIGYGFYVEFTLDEALRFIDKKTKQFTDTTASLTKTASKIKAHIKLVLEGLREMQYLGNQPAQKPQRDLFS